MRRHHKKHGSGIKFLKGGMKGKMNFATAKHIHILEPEKRPIGR